MKRLFTIMMAVMLAMVCYGQHLKFNGIDIDGHIDSFEKKLFEQGYVHVYSEGNVRMYQGDYLASEALLFVTFTKRTKTVYSVVASLKEMSEWIYLSAIYDIHTSTYGYVYGEPDQKINKFEYPYKEGDGREMEALYLGKCKKQTGFAMNDGTILISITAASNKNGSNKKGQIKIAHMDNKNYERSCREDK